MMKETTSAGKKTTSSRIAGNFVYMLFFPIIALIIPYPCLGELNNTIKSNNNECQGPTWSLPCTWSITQLGNKGYYIGHFFKANWYLSHQLCVFHGMRLASIENQEENLAIVKYFQENGFQDKNQNFWTSGTDQAKEGSFVWFGNGKPITFSDWTSGQPDNAGGHENCIELWNLHGKKHTWNDRPCRDLNFFLCEI